MRKLDKTEILATKYIKWEDEFEDGMIHPKYNSSNGKFYYDIIANLIWIQKGLCAYTECLMQDYKKFVLEKWEDGSFKKFAFAGELDHYNPVLKTNQGWLWNNFFLIDSDINSKKVKSNNVPIGILKPDNIDFNPLYFLEYDSIGHFFIPSKERTIEEQNNIKHDIDTLGLNWQPMIERREIYLTELINDVRYGIKSFDEVKSNLKQFFTTFELCKDYMK